MILRFSEFVLEKYSHKSRGRLILLKEAIDYYQKNCSNWNLNDAQIFRGTRDKNKKFSIYSPSKHERISANTSNVYTKLINILPAWLKYPKRSRSLICTTNVYRAQDFVKDSENLNGIYVVIPTNGSKIVIAPKFDFWVSFKKTKSMADFNDRFSWMVEDLLNKNINYDNITDNNFKLLLNTLEAKIKTYNFPADYFGVFNFNKWKKILNSTKTKFINILDDILNPEINDFMLISTKNQSILKKSNDNEVWTDGDCLLISLQEFEEFKNKVLQK
jgi:hypothetical protein